MASWPHLRLHAFITLGVEACLPQDHRELTPEKHVVKSQYRPRSRRKREFGACLFGVAGKATAGRRRRELHTAGGRWNETFHRDPRETRSVTQLGDMLASYGACLHGFKRCSDFVYQHHRTSSHGCQMNPQLLPHNASKHNGACWPDILRCSSPCPYTTASLHIGCVTIAQRIFSPPPIRTRLIAKAHHEHNTNRHDVIESDCYSQALFINHVTFTRHYSPVIPTIQTPTP